MLKRWMMGVLLVVVIAAAGIALAQTDNSSLTWQPGHGMMGQGMMGHGMMGRHGFGGHGFGGHGFGGGMMHGTTLTTVANALDMELTALIDELEAGKTVAEIATDQGVALETIISALTAPHAEWMAVLVERGVLTQEQADARLTLMTEHVTEWLNEATLDGSFSFGWGSL